MIHDVEDAQRDERSAITKGDVDLTSSADDARGQGIEGGVRLQYDPCYRRRVEVHHQEAHDVIEGAVIADSFEVSDHMERNCTNPRASNVHSLDVEHIPYFFGTDDHEYQERQQENADTDACILDVHHDLAVIVDGDWLCYLQNQRNRAKVLTFTQGCGGIRHYQVAAVDIPSSIIGELLIPIYAVSDLLGANLAVCV